MNIAERSAADAARSIASALEDAGMPYAIGGALALAIAGGPRGTADVDVDVDVSSCAHEQRARLLEVARVELARCVGRDRGVGGELTRP